MRRDFPTNPQLEASILAALKQLGGQGTTSEIDNKVVEILSLPDDVVQLEDESGLCTKLNYCLRWCRTKLKNCGKIESVKKGLWRLKE